MKMNKLIVFNTYEEKMGYLNKYGEAECSTVSLEEGVGRIDTKGSRKFDLIYFYNNKIEGSVQHHLALLERFYKGLSEYKLIHSETKIM
ncbi:hypothetical protein [Priestia flexa]|uniref:hypothetical protein n=1 Tax=Priestia flexa TaxID=86664 RepID=UPI000474015F|nr:hypothetical protein [Priestia flexa]